MRRTSRTSEASNRLGTRKTYTPPHDARVANHVSALVQPGDFAAWIGVCFHSGQGDTMSWQERLRQMILAGGMLAAGCSSSDGNNVPPVVGGGCGNANPDPCICGRPESSDYYANLCADERSCQAAGGVWTYVGFNVPGTCRADGGADPRVDAGASPDGHLDGDVTD
jgi:hypothetical protein